MQDDSFHTSPPQAGLWRCSVSILKQKEFSNQFTGMLKVYRIKTSPGHTHRGELLVTGTKRQKKKKERKKGCLTQCGVTLHSLTLSRVIST